MPAPRSNHAAQVAAWQRTWARLLTPRPKEETADPEDQSEPAEGAADNAVRIDDPAEF